jgi:hypothetical protein
MLKEFYKISTCIAQPVGRKVMLFFLYKFCHLGFWALLSMRCFSQGIQYSVVKLLQVFFVGFVNKNLAREYS